MGQYYEGDIVHDLRPFADTWANVRNGNITEFFCISCLKMCWRIEKYGFYRFEAHNQP